MEWIDIFTDFFASAIRLTSPIALGTLACTISEKAGVTNIGIEGSMIFCGLLAAVGSYYSGNPWIGMLCGCLAGMFLAAILGVLAIYCDGQQIVVGIGLNLLGPGLAYIIMRAIWGTTGISPWVTGFTPIEIPVIKDIPILGPIVSGYSACVYVGILAVIIMHFVLKKTPWGLRIRSVGENPKAVETLGINVYRLRFNAVVLGGFFVGMAGGVMCLNTANVFVNEMSAGSGFMAFAANQFGQWSPVGGYLASLLFGAMSAFRIRLQSIGLASQLSSMLPYIATLIALKITGKNLRAPAANGLPYPHPLAIPQMRKKASKKG